MCRKREIAFQVFHLLILGQQLTAFKYQFVPENEDIYSICSNQPDHVLNKDEIANLTDMTFTLNKDSITISGNMSFVWNVQSSDRIQVHFEILRYDRGSWLSTVLAMNVHDFCKVMFDKNQYWYRFWTKHLTNADELKNKCPLNNPGTYMIHEPFDVDAKFEAQSIVPMSGRYKIQVIVKAFDKRNMERKERACTDIIGEFIRI